MPSPVKYLTSGPSTLCITEISAQHAFNPISSMCLLIKDSFFELNNILHKRKTNHLFLGNSEQFKMICTALSNHSYGKF